MQENDDFSDTTGALAREAETTPATVRLYTALGLIESRTASNGTRLYRPGTAKQVREILAQRLANRGRRRA